METCTDNRPRHTPRTLSEHYGISINKVLEWFAAGELRAINIAAKTSTRPRYIIRQEDVELFEAERATMPRAAAKRQPKTPADVKEFFS